MTISKAVQDRAFQAVKEVNHDFKNFHLLYSLPDFINGSLLVIGFENEEGRTFENSVYIAGDMVRVAKSPSQFAHLVKEESKRESRLAYFINAGGVAGVIALILTLTVCYLIAFTGAKEVPTFLSSSLATILGFYFGTKVVSVHPARSLRESRPTRRSADRQQWIMHSSALRAT